MSIFNKKKNKKAPDISYEEPPVISYEELYKKTYPEKSHNVSGLRNILLTQNKIRRITYFWKDISSNDYSSLEVLNTTVNINDPAIPKMLWLFWDSDITLVINDLVKLAVKLDNIDLIEDDYALLLLSSYQDEDTKALIKNLPLDMVYDMYKPLAESNFEKWYKKVFDDYNSDN